MTKKIIFDEYYDENSQWRKSGNSSNMFNKCVKFREDKSYIYYICYDDCSSDVFCYRVKKKKICEHCGAEIK